jgi:hypothetical protein
VYVPSVSGAVYAPAAEMLPPPTPSIDQSTAGADDPARDAVKVCSPLGANVTCEGDTCSIPEPASVGIQ